MGVGLRIKTILREKKMTIKQLSENTGIPLNTLYSITKRDSDRVDNVIIMKISTALGVPPAFLMDIPDDVRQALEFAGLEEKHKIGTATKKEEDRYLELCREQKRLPAPSLPTDIDYLRSNAVNQLEELNDEGVKMAADIIDTMHSSSKYNDKVPPTTDGPDVEE